jgi:hypothetical protein
MGDNPEHTVDDSIRGRTTLVVQARTEISPHPGSESMRLVAVLAHVHALFVLDVIPMFGRGYAALL